MKIALFCSSRNIIPAKKTGGTEQPIFYLAKTLAQRGHKVVLFAAKGSKIPRVEVRHISNFQTCVEQRFLNIQERIASFLDLNAMSNFFQKEANDFDVIQFNSYMFYEILPFTRFCKTPVIIRINYPHDLIYPYIKKELKDYKNVFYLPISKSIKKSMPGLSYLKEIPPSIDFNDFGFSSKKGGYLLFIGRVCHNKGTHLAVQIAQKLNMKLIIAGRIDQEQGKAYFEEQIKPHLNKKIKYVGEVGFKEKVKLYQGAIVTLFPILWDEPFGNVQIESMACGTPVITFSTGACKEAVKNAISGFIVKDLAEMARAVSGIDKISRSATREWVISNFSLDIVTNKYEQMYKKIIANKNQLYV